MLRSDEEVRGDEVTPARRRMLDAAIEAFAEHGYGGTGTRDIARRAGRSPASVYVHYPSKEHLLFGASILGHQEALEVVLDAVSGAGDPVARLRAVARDFSAWHLAHRRIARVVHHELGSLSEEHLAAVLPLRRRLVAEVVGVLRDGVERGDFELADPEAVAAAVLSLGIDLVRWYDPDRGRDPEALADLNADLALRLAGARDH